MDIPRSGAIPQISTKMGSKERGYPSNTKQTETQKQAWRKKEPLKGMPSADNDSFSCIV